MNQTRSTNVLWIALTTLVLVSCSSGSDNSTPPDTSTQDVLPTNNEMVQVNEVLPVNLELAADDFAGRDVAGSSFLNRGVSSARLTGPVYGDSFRDPPSVRTIPIFLENSSRQVVPVSAYISSDAINSSSELYLTLKNTSNVPACLISLEYTFELDDGTLGRENPIAFFSHGSYGTWSAEQNINSDCLLPSESGYLRKDVFSDNLPDRVTKLVIHELDSRVGREVPGVQIQASQYEFVGDRLVYAIELINSGTVPFSVSRIYLYALNNLGQPVGFLSTANLVDGNVEMQPGETQRYQLQLANSGQFSTMRVVADYR